MVLPFLKTQKLRRPEENFKVRYYHVYERTRKQTLSNTLNILEKLFLSLSGFHLTLQVKDFVELHNITTVKVKMSSKREALHLKKD